MKKKILILDFCETLVFAQTADDFVKFIAKKIFYRRLIFIISTFLVYLKIIKFINFFFKTRISLKDLITFSLIGIKETELYEYGKLYSNARLYEISKLNVINKIKKFITINKPEEVIILSGGYDYYMYEFLKIHQININYIISSKIRLFKEKFIFGGLKMDCMHQNKLNLLNEKLNIKNYSISFFTDDIKADSSIIQISDNVFIVRDDTIENYSQKFLLD